MLILFARPQDAELDFVELVSNKLVVRAALVLKLLQAVENLADLWEFMQVRVKVLRWVLESLALQVSDFVLVRVYELSEDAFHLLCFQASG
jgi:hypothetical protein